MKDQKNKKQSRGGILRSLLGAALLTLFLTGMPVHGVIFNVNTTDDTIDVNPGDGIAADINGDTSIRAAIMEANVLAGMDAIVIPNGYYSLEQGAIREDKCYTGDLDIRDHLEISGENKTAVIIDGGLFDRVFHIVKDYRVTIYSLTIQRGQTPEGEALVPGPVTYDLDGLDGSGGEGGGILNVYGNLTVKNCLLIRNRTGKGGNYFDPMLRNGDGGYGAGIFNYQGKLSIYETDIKGNLTGDGGYYIPDPMVSGGDGGDGGGIYNYDGEVLIEKSSITNNYTGKNGNMFDVHEHTGAGAGIFNQAGPFRIFLSQVLYNECGQAYCGIDCGGGGGGGIYNQGSLLVDHCSISYNKAGSTIAIDGAGGSGGGIMNKGTAFVYHSLLAGNETGEGDEYPTGTGGGICNFEDMTVVNSTISGNKNALLGGYYLGGGIYNWKGTLTLESCTVVNNETEWEGAGIYNDSDSNPSSTVRLHNTIVANNFITWSLAQDDCWGEIESLGYNLIEDTSNCTIVGVVTGNIYGSAPILGPLADNSGFTMTHALLFGSPCIDTGDFGSYEQTDQRDQARPADGDGNGSTLPDMGAYEKYITRLSWGFSSILRQPLQIKRNPSQH